MSSTVHTVHGLTRSYFTRKVTGYLDYTDRPWRLQPCPPHLHPGASAAGWTGGIPVVTTPQGEFMWDSTSIIEHLELATEPHRQVVPEDATLQFLAFLLDDFSDEWFYRPAVGSRWSYAANTEPAGWQIAEELSAAIGLPGSMVRPNVVETMTASLPRLGVTEANIDAWMNHVVVPWFQALDAHLGAGYLLGERPCIADFAVFGANVAHFVGDPYCRDLADQHGAAAVAHTHRLQMQRYDGTDGPWLQPDDLPQSLIDVIAQAGRHYLPWAAEATVAGSAEVELADGVIAEMEASNFLKQARGVMLARYVRARSPQLDDILERAGVLGFFANHIDQATTVPDLSTGSQPADNRPYATS